MSNTKSNYAARRAGGSKVFDGHSESKGRIPDHLVTAILACIGDQLSADPENCDQQIAFFLTKIQAKPVIGIEYGLSPTEVDAFIQLWSDLTRGGRVARPRNLLTPEVMARLRARDMMAKPSPLYNGDPVLTALGEAIRRARRAAV